jgi:S1-C subfamily serine protease
LRVATADWIVLVIVVASALYGLSRGLVRGALSLAGFALGAYLGAHLANGISRGSSPYAPLVALGGALVVGMLFQSLAVLLGGFVRTGMSAVPGLRTVDAAAGFVLGAVAGVFFCWALGAVLLYLPGQTGLRRAVQESAILTRINAQFPPERLLQKLERVDPLGVVVGPPAIVAPPDRGLAKDPNVIAASRSVVRVTGIACGLGIEGSGWITGRGLVVTNAHVVAGISRPSVDRRSGPADVATVVVFDVTNDLAVLRVPGLTGRPLTLANPDRGVPVALVGYPENGPLTRTPGRLGGTGDAISRDAYGHGPVLRALTAIRGAVRPGNSGGPAIDAEGRVRTTVFARRPDDVGGYGIPSQLVRAALSRAGTKSVPHGACVT